MCQRHISSLKSAVTIFYSVLEPLIDVYRQNAIEVFKWIDKCFLEKKQGQRSEYSPRR